MIIIIVIEIVIIPERSARLVTAPAGSRDSPGVRFLVFVIQRLKSKVLLVLGQLCRIGKAEEGIGKFDEPFRIDRCHLQAFTSVSEGVAEKPCRP